ncbi:MAG: SelT/SelW/SelH family protein [Thermodesulfobacteriota bacterium]
MKNNHRVEIIYCTKCKWLMRSAWIAQEILTTFDQELSEVALLPCTDGIFEIRVNKEIVWSLRNEGRFPDIKELKKLLRDIIAPEKLLGHTDR